MASTALVVLIAAVAGAVLGGLGLYVVAFSLKKKSEAEMIQQREELKLQFSALSQGVFSSATQEFLKLAETRMSTEQLKHKSEFNQERQAVETAINALNEKLKGYETLVRSFEKDREQKYGSLEAQLKSAVATTERLQTTTDSLQSVLSNSRVRGQWGERMAEDILRSCGFQENIQYKRNKAQDTVSTRPDYTFFLPDDHKFYMDVKFPLDNYMRMMSATTDDEKSRLKNDFIKDVKARIKEITKRDYINPEERTLDYILLFIPNEQVYGFLQEASPGLLDEAMAQKVVMCSPFTFYAVLSIIRQSYDNFHFAEATQEVVKLIGGFRKAWETFKERFARLGEQLSKTRDTYDEIAGASYKKIDLAVQKIEKVSKGQAEAAEVVPEIDLEGTPRTLGLDCSRP